MISTFQFRLFQKTWKGFYFKFVLCEKTSDDFYLLLAFVSSCVMCSPFERFGEFGFRIAESLHCQELSQLREGLTDSQAVQLRPATSDTSVLKYLDQRQSTEATHPSQSRMKARHKDTALLLERLSGLDPRHTSDHLHEMLVVHLHDGKGLQRTPVWFKGPVDTFVQARMQLCEPSFANAQTTPPPRQTSGLFRPTQTGDARPLISDALHPSNISGTVFTLPFPSHTMNHYSMKTKENGDFEDTSKQIAQACVQWSNNQTFKFLGNVFLWNLAVTFLLWSLWQP